RAHLDARLILAHCAIGAYERVIPFADEVPNLLFDTSWWNPSDVWGLLHAVAPSRVLYASDIPFGSPAQSFILTARLAIEAGLDDAQLASVLGGQLERLAAHEDLLDTGPLAADPGALRPPLERIYVTLCSAVEPMLRGEAPGQGLELARVACSRPHGPDAEVIASIAALLELVDEAEPDPLRTQRRPGWDLVLTAAVLARTPSAPVPSEARVLAAI
ncbi:MAG TPA: amidohydrolase family protein, partial [Capillimicrobium sp.]